MEVDETVDVSQGTISEDLKSVASLMNLLPEIIDLIIEKLVFDQPIKPALRCLLSLGSVSSQWNKFTQKTIERYFFDFKSLSNAIVSKFLSLESFKLDEQPQKISHTILQKLTNLKKIKTHSKRTEALPLITNLKNLTAIKCPFSYFSENLLPSSLLNNLEDIFVSEFEYKFGFGEPPTDNYNIVLDALSKLTKLGLL